MEKLFFALNGYPGQGLTITQRLIAVIILAAVLVAIVGTEVEAQNLAGPWLARLELSFGLVFLMEYVARVASAGVDPAFRGFVGRLRFMARPMSVVDAIAVAPFLLGLLGIETVLLRLLRVMRLLAISKLSRYSQAMRLVWGAVHERRYELGFAFVVALTLMVLASAGMYVLEADNNPEAFGSIPRAMWYAAAVLTTVGYGDVVPATIAGRAFAVLAALAGVGLIALPAGILAGAFNDAFARQRELRLKAGHTEQETS